MGTHNTYWLIGGHINLEHTHTVTHKSFQQQILIGSNLLLEKTQFFSLSFISQWKPVFLMQLKTLWMKLKLNKAKWSPRLAVIGWDLHKPSSHNYQFPSSVNQNWEVWYMEVLYFALGQTKVVQKNLTRLHQIRSDLVYSTNECLMLVEI